MIDVGLMEKINKLKSLFIEGDDSAKKQITEWENKIRELSLAQDFMSNEVSQELFSAIKNRVKGHMKYRLQTGRTPDELRMSDEREKECRWLLSLFKTGYEHELETLEQLIDNEM